MSDPMQSSNRKLSDEAKRLEKLSQFAQAADLYKQSYDQYPGSFVTSHYIRCLRRQGKSEEAVEFGRQLSKQLLNDPYVHKELSWALYDAYLKKTEDADDKEDGDTVYEKRSGQNYQQMQKAASYILSKAPATEDILRNRTVFAICHEAKQREIWQDMHDFAVQLDPERLSKEQQEWKGQKISSDYQKWLYQMVRSLLELKRYEESMEFAQRGIDDNPREKLFPWWKASAKMALGQIEDALYELEQIDVRFLKEWYIQRDIADGYHRLQKYDEAMLWYCKAASCQGDIKGRFKMFEQMSVLFEHLERLQEAHDHMQLACAITEREGWEHSAGNLRGQLVQFRKRHADHIASPTGVTTEEWSKLFRRCKTLWKETVGASLPTCKGEIVKVNDEKGFGFIRRHDDESNRDIYFKFRSFAKGVTPKLGVEVEFELEKSFDPGKNQESLTAVNIRQKKSSV